MEFKEKWITDGLEAEAVISAKELGESLADQKVSTSQIRNVFGEIRRVQALGVDSDGKNRLYMIEPKLAYVMGKSKGEKQGFKDLLKVVNKSVPIVLEKNSKERFGNFVNYMEAVVAYHRYNGGTN